MIGVRLAAELDEVRGLGGAGRVDRAVVADDADRVAVESRVAAHRRHAVAGLEVEEVGAVDEAGDDFAHVVGLFRVERHQAEQFVDVAPWYKTRRSVRTSRFQSSLAITSRGEADGVGVVLGEVFGRP
jgi:hypothetical protein